jgi:CRISPR-associated protein Csd1
MILQSLARYYEILEADPGTEIAPPGYSKVGVSFALNISEKGDLLDVFPLLYKEQRGKKIVDVPRRMVVPEQVKRSSGINPNFLCDNNVYVLGITSKESSKPDYAHERFTEFRKFNKSLLEQADCEAAQAVIAFLDRHEPTLAREHDAIARNLETILKGGNLVFMFQRAYVHEDPLIKQAWDTYRAGKDAVWGQCLVTGEIAPIARLHPSLKGVRGTQPTGASLVSFNERAYESYNRTKGQGLNSPVSEKAAFAYTTALNYLLSADNPNRPILLGDATVVYWAESEKKEYPAAFSSIINPKYIELEPTEHNIAHREEEERLGNVALKVQRIQALDVAKLTEGLDKYVHFYILGLAPNASRLSVRFFITEPFGKIIERIMRHYEDLKIEKEFDDQLDYIPLRTILYETVSKKSKDKEAMPLLAGAIVRAILTDSPYPAALYYAIINRFRADVDDSQNHIQKINYVRAAVVKAYLRRKYRHNPQHPFQEVLEMSLNETSTIPAYVLGRLFAELEKVQQEAVGNINASIKDRYFTSACASPSTVFPVLLRLSQHHISKAKYGHVSDNHIRDLLNMLDVENNPFPARLSLDEQGIFVLGYYHQRAAFYKPKSNDQETDSEVNLVEKELDN